MSASNPCTLTWIGKEARPRWIYHYVRWHWVHQSIQSNSITPGGRTPVRLDLNTLIDQIMIDPHATALEAKAVKDEALSIGFANEVLHSPLFELPARLRPYALRP